VIEVSPEWDVPHEFDWISHNKKVKIQVQVWMFDFELYGGRWRCSVTKMRDMDINEYNIEAMWERIAN
jgi:hypothetical protein